MADGDISKGLRAMKGGSSSSVNNDPVASTTDGVAETKHTVLPPESSDAMNNNTENNPGEDSMFVEEKEVDIVEGSVADKVEDGEEGEIGEGET
jgi:hypothetical protein